VKTAAQSWKWFIFIRNGFRHIQ